MGRLCVERNGTGKYRHTPFENDEMRHRFHFPRDDQIIPVETGPDDHCDLHVSNVEYWPDVATWPPRIVRDKASSTNNDKNEEACSRNQIGGKIAKSRQADAQCNRSG